MRCDSRFRKRTRRRDPHAQLAARRETGSPHAAPRHALPGRAAALGNQAVQRLLEGKEITQPEQVTADNRADFEAGLRQLRDKFGPEKQCLLNDTEEGYFRAGGKLVAQWVSPELTSTWDERKSKCFAGLDVVTADPASEEDFSPGPAGHCRKIRIERKP